MGNRARAQGGGKAIGQWGKKATRQRGGRAMGQLGKMAVGWELMLGKAAKGVSPAAIGVVATALSLRSVRPMHQKPRA